MSVGRRIAVIGAGLGGLTAAGFLQRAGFDVTVFEQAAAFSRIGAGIHLSANVMIVMERLGIAQKLMQIGLHPDAFVSRKWDTGEILFELPFDAASESRYGAAYINVHRADLHAVMESALDHGTVVFGRKLQDVVHVGDALELKFESGERVVADIVIGADGVNSRVRGLLRDDGKPRFTGHVAHRAVFPTARLKGQPIGACTKWWGEDRHILVYYMTHTREEVYLVSSVPEPVWDQPASVLPCDPASFQAAFEGFHPALRAVVAAAPEVTKWPVFDRDLIDGWSGERIVLLGDACHPLRPYMAQGAAMAIEDAAVLARCLEATGPGDWASAFAAYEATRMPRVREVQRISMANIWLREPTDPTWLFAYDATKIDLAGL